MRLLRALSSRPLLRFTLSGLIALVLLGVGAAWASGRLGTAEAVRDARSRATLLGGVVQPILAEGAAGGFVGTSDQIDAVIEQQIANGRLVRVKVWDQRGTIVYSNDRRLEGERFALDQRRLRVLTGSSPLAHVSELELEENILETHEDKLLEVYVPLTVGPERYIFEAYFSYDSVSTESRKIWLLFAPVLLVGLLALEVVQVPLAWSMGRQLDDASRERYQLMAELEAQAERERIARDLHDDVMQSIYGIGLRFHASVKKPDVTKESLVAEATDDLSSTIATLRRYMDQLTHNRSEITPRSLRKRLETLLVDSGEVPRWRLRIEGDVTQPSLSGQLYLVVKELTSNVNRHADADRAWVSVIQRGGWVEISVQDDGHGFDRAKVRETSRGLRGIEARVAELGGELKIDSSIGRGTTARVRVPDSLG